MEVEALEETRRESGTGATPEGEDLAGGRAEEADRGRLGDPGNLAGESRGKLGEGQLEEKAEKGRRRTIRILLRMAPFGMTVIAVLVAVVMLARCIADMSQFGGASTTVAGTASRRQDAGTIPTVDVDYAGLEEMFGSSESASSAGRTAPPIDMPAFDDWYDNDDEYIAAMCEKANKYDSDTEWLATIDTDLCRATWFTKSGGKWKACGGYCTIAGKTAIKRADGSIENAWATGGYSGWPGPRACTPHGAFKVLEGRMETANGTRWNTCHYPAAHLGEGADHDCYCHRQHENYGVDPATLPLANRHQSHGCTRYRNEVAQWVYKNIPAHTTIVVFDQLNPEPEECDMNDRSNESKVDWDKGDWATWPGYAPLLSASYDRTAACGRSSDPESGKAGHISGGKGRKDLERDLNSATAGSGALSDGRMTGAQQRVVSAAESTPTAGASRCLAWVGDVFDNAGYGFARLPTAGDACRQYCHSTNRGDLRPGMIIAVESTVSSPGIGHIGIYMGNGKVRDNETSGGGGIVVTRPLDEWLQIFSAAGTPRWGWAGNNDLSRQA